MALRIKSSALSQLTDPHHPRRHDGVVVFQKPGCPACHRNEAAVTEVADHARRLYPRAVVATIDVKKHPDAADAHDVRSVPTTIFFKGGSEVTRIVGARDAAEYVNQCRIYDETLEAGQEADDSISDLTNVLSNGGAVLLHSPNCGHCVHYKPIFDEFAAQLPHAAKIDITAADMKKVVEKMPEAQVVYEQGVPSTFFVAAGSDPVEYNGERTVADLKAYYDAM